MNKEMTSKQAIFITIIGLIIIALYIIIIYNNSIISSYLQY